jgi:signal transduction histidine kinase/ActR/RegA family two-component response regulator
MTGLFSLVENPPPGFVYTVPSKRKLLTGHIALFVNELEDALSLLADFRKRVQGLIITTGRTFSHQALSPRLWHLTIPSNYLLLSKELSVFYLDILIATHDENEKNRVLIEEMTYDSQFYAQTQDGYNKAMERLQVMVQEAHQENEKRKEVIARLNHEIQERKKAQEEQLRLESRLHQSQKMEAIGLMAGGVAHDLNNILAGVVGYPDILLASLPQDSNLRQPLENIRNSGRRAAEVVADLLTIARSSANPRETANLNMIILQYLDSLEFQRLKSVYPNVSFVLDCDKNLANIRCSVSHIKKCLMNLVVNGVESISDTGRLRISTRSQDIECDERSGDQVIKKGRYAVLSVEDSGHGIEDEHLAHIFEPFYSRKKMEFSGSGLGLTVVWNAMQEHGGGIRVSSSSEGTTFELLFPATTKVLSEQENAVPLDHLLGNQETIMVVDDEELLLDVACGMLTALNYKVVTKKSGEEAIAYLRTADVDLIILDMIMKPGMNGQQTFEEILRIRPGQRAIIASGFAKNDDVNHVLERGAGSYLRKPYTTLALGKAIQDCLTAKSK